jgi:hypothetical protein
MRNAIFGKSSLLQYHAHTRRFNSAPIPVLRDLAGPDFGFANNDARKSFIRGKKFISKPATAARRSSAIDGAIGRSHDPRHRPKLHAI